jgi:dihydroorotate dehydrogenase (NAD+) catalytic subunit
MKGNMGLPKYDISQTYDWNYANAPAEAVKTEIPSCPGSWDFCGIPTDSPLGIPAGPLLNSGWILYYARLGFSVLTYKTVRSAFRACYEPPNLLPVDATQLSGNDDVVRAPAAVSNSWAISFGMPSKDRTTWQRDVEVARKGLASNQVLAVSIVATPQPDWTLEDMAEDFVRCAKWARDAGAQAVEANLSCPNVCTQEGQLYKSPDSSAEIAARIRSAIAGLPLILKIGLFDNREQAAGFVEAVDRHAAALSTVNSVSAQIVGHDGQAHFAGLSRGIGGACIRNRCQAEVAVLDRVIRERGSKLRLIAVGGIGSAADVQERMAAGAHHVQLATAAMLDPLVAVRIRSEMFSEPLARAHALQSRDRQGAEGRHKT